MRSPRLSLPLQLAIRFLALVAWLAAAGEAQAESGAVLPVDAAVGPDALFVSGPVYRDQPVHLALRVSIEAVLTQDVLREIRARLDPKYRRYAERRDEVRVSPTALLPSILILSPRIEHTALWGVGWRTLGASLPFSRGPFRGELGAGLAASAFYLSSTTLPTTFFLRPGVEVKAEGLWMFNSNLGLSGGWASTFYVPQEVGAFGIGPFSRDLWHIGQAFLKLHMVSHHWVGF